MQITFAAGYSRWIANVTGAELEALTKLFAKAVKCHTSWPESSESKSGIVDIDKGERLDMSIQVMSQAVTLREWVEPPPKPDVKPEPAKALPNIAKSVQLPDVRDFMDEQLASREEDPL